MTSNINRCMAEVGKRRWFLCKEDIVGRPEPNSSNGYNSLILSMVLKREKQASRAPSKPAKLERPQNPPSFLVEIILLVYKGLCQQGLWCCPFLMRSSGVIATCCAESWVTLRARLIMAFDDIRCSQSQQTRDSWGQPSAAPYSMLPNRLTRISAFFRSTGSSRMPPVGW